MSVVGSGGAHLKAYFRDSENDVGGIGWRMGGHANDFKKGELVDVAFQLEINVWQSRESAQLLILDMKSSAAIDDYAIPV